MLRKRDNIRSRGITTKAEIMAVTGIEVTIQSEGGAGAAVLRITDAIEVTSTNLIRLISTRKEIGARVDRQVKTAIEEGKERGSTRIEKVIEETGEIDTIAMTIEIEEIDMKEEVQTSIVVIEAVAQKIRIHTVNGETAGIAIVTDIITNREAIVQVPPKKREGGGTTAQNLQSE